MSDTSDQNKSVVVVKDLKKAFRLPRESNSGLKQFLLSLFRRDRKKGYEIQKVLKGVSFEVNQGDFFGIVGRNGSGKSTLLKLLAGIYTPDSGAVQTNGTIVPFIELGVGFNPDLTGRENVFLNGALLGFSHEEVESMYDEVVEFAELGRFMDQKLKNYSSGMQVRLAFSIAIKARGDILILDEVLAVGDEAFQRKCEDFFNQIKKDKSKTVILVTHSMGNVRKYCNKAMMIHKGAITAIGSPEEVANEYSLQNLTSSETQTKKDKKDQENTSIIDAFKVGLVSDKQINQDDKVVAQYSITASADTTVTVVTDLCNLSNNAEIYCFDTSKIELKAGKRVESEVSFDVEALNDMDLVIRSSVRDADGNVLAFANEANSPQFLLRRNDYPDQKPQAGLIFKNGKNAEWR